MESSLIFVYGTLLSSVPSPASKWLSKHAKLMGPGCFSGYLYDLGAYPGFVYEPGAAAKVLGEVHQLKDPVAGLGYLDRYEGLDLQDPMYRRLSLPHPDYGPVWVYVFLGATAGLPRVSDGNYLNYYPQQVRHRLFIEQGE